MDVNYIIFAFFTLYFYKYDIMFIKKTVLSLLLPLIFLFSCSSLDVTNDWDRNVDFRSFKTFSLYPWDYKNGYQINDYDKQTILNTIQNELEDKGYTYVKDSGDMVVSIFITLKGKTSYDAYTNHYGGWAGYGGGWGYYGFGYGYGWGPGYGYGTGYSTTTVTERHYNEGSLIIDVFNAADKKLIWQGIGSREVEYDLDKRDEKLPKNVHQILAKFPAVGKK